VLYVEVGAACNCGESRNTKEIPACAGMTSRIKILDLLGNEVMTGNINSLNFAFSTLHLKSGIYFVKVACPYDWRGEMSL